MARCNRLVVRYDGLSAVRKELPPRYRQPLAMSSVNGDTAQVNAHAV